MQDVQVLRTRGFGSVTQDKLYILMVNGEFVTHPMDHVDETLRGRPVKINRILLRDIITNMIREMSMNEVGDNFQVFRVR
jgi:hypothetical protein